MSARRSHASPSLARRPGHQMQYWYTLKEYMVERVLQPHGTIAYPCRVDGRPFLPQELSTLVEVEWSDFGDEFRSDVQCMISHTLASTRPFLLKKSAAKGAQFPLWCNKVLELVNSKLVLPNIPDLQQHLLQSLADDAVDKAIRIYSKEIGDYLDSCPVYNNKNDDKKKKKKDGGKDNTISMSDLKGVAEERDLHSQSQNILDRLSTELKTEIILESMLEAALKRITTKRLKVLCDQLARVLYHQFRDLVRSNATSMSPEAFESGARDVETSFRVQARGPAVEEAVRTFLKEQKEVDKVFLDKVHVINDLYQQTLEIKEKLDKDVQEKTKLVTNLETHIEVTTKEHQEELERRGAAAKEEMEKLRKAHVKEMEDAIKEQKPKKLPNLLP